MNNVICAIYDEKTQVYFGVHESPTIGHAIRQFGDHVKNPNSPLNRHPGDYKLYRIGSMDPTSGLIKQELTPVYLSTALDFLQPITLTPVTTTDEILKSSVEKNVSNTNSRIVNKK
ncbi:MAG: DNA binding protein [Microviridae sp. ctD0m35]|nr:MAG: DNA binding protein [Microviridae sp. ctudC31]QGH72987.1 MAG: DNA binding protein [Microviridae sp. ctD0m35]